MRSVDTNASVCNRAWITYATSVDHCASLLFAASPSSLTRSILSTLATANANASFFIVGSSVTSTSTSNAVKAAYAAGHLIGDGNW